MEQKVLKETDRCEHLISDQVSLQSSGGGKVLLGGLYLNIKGKPIDFLEDNKGNVFMTLG